MFKRVTKKKVSKRLENYGGCFAGSDKKYQANWDQPKIWHIHRDASNPQQRDILSFTSLYELDEWLEEAEVMKQAAADQYEELRERAAGAGGWV